MEEIEQNPEDEALDHLIRQAREPEPVDFVRPPDELVLAYLNGTATKDQGAIVQRALLQSPAFRQELAGLAADFDRLSLPEVEVQFGNVVVPPVRDWPSFRDRVQAASGGRDEANPFRLAEPDAPLSTGARVSRAIDELLGQVGGTVQEAVELVLSALSPLPVSQFAPALLRGSQADECGSPIAPAAASPIAPATLDQDADSTPPTVLVYRDPGETPEEAAILGLADRLQWTGRVLRIVGAEPEVADDPLTASSPSREVLLLAHDQSGSLIHQVGFRIPNAATEVTAWILLVPSMELYSVDVGRSPLPIRWPAEVPGSACFVVTWNVEGGFRSSGVAYRECR